MNKKSTRYQQQGFSSRIVFCGSTVGLILFLFLLRLPVTSAADSGVPSPNPVVTTDPATPPDSSQPARHAAALAPTRYSECLQLLEGTDRVNPALVENVSSMLNHPSDATPAAPQIAPSLMVVSYHEQAGKPRDVVVELFFDPIAGGQSLLSEDSYAHARLGDELSGTANQFLGLISRQVAYFGQKDEVERQQRAYQAVLNGDLTLLREQTVDPLHVVVVMPRAGAFLPSSLRSRVRGIVMDAELAFGTWSSRIGMVTDDSEAAEQVGNIVAAWREMALSFADTFASRSSVKQLRESLKASTVQVVANRVLTSASVDSRLVVRASSEVAIHGDNCPPGGICSKDKVAICHKVDSQREQTVCVPPAEVAPLLARGDHCGPCASAD
jgi:hypothetical protein